MKKIIDYIMNFFKKILEKDLFIKILSLVSAVVIWFVVSINVYPTIDRVIYNVPIVIDMQGTYAEAHNFQVVSQTETEGTVYITGDRGQIGDLTNADLKIVASAENVINAADYNLPLTVECSSGKEFTVNKIATSENSSAEYISVDFDEIVTKTVEVKPLMDNVHIAQGYISDADEVVIVPNTIDITGPKDTISDVTAAYINVESDEELSSTYEYVATDAVLYTGDSPLSTDADITLSRNSFTVHVPILLKQTLPLNVRITNAPESFDTEAFIEKLTMSVSELEVAAPNENIKNRDSLDIGSIDMREVDIGSAFEFRTADFLPEEYQNLSGIDTVTVTCPSEGLYKLSVTIRGSAIQIINAPVQYDYKIITSGFSMNFIGSEESIRQLSYIDVIAQIDLINYEVEERDYKLPVTFYTPSYDDVWCISSDGDLSPKATVTVTLKS